MSLSLNTNISALSAQRNLRLNNSAAASSIGKLSSGSRIVTAKDDAASLSIASGLSLDLASLRAANANISQATSVLQIADGGYGQISEVLNRMKTLAATASSDQISDTERGFLNTEYQQLTNQIDSIASATSYNGLQLIGGGVGLEVDQATGVGSDLEQADGFAGFSFDPAKRSGGTNGTQDGEFVNFSYDATTHVMTAEVRTAAFGGGNTLATQSIDLDDIGGDPFNLDGAIPTGSTANFLDDGESFKLNFDNIGVSVELNDTFNASTAIAGSANTDVQIEASVAPPNDPLDFVTGVNASTDVIQVTLSGATVSDLGLSAAVSGKATARTASQEIDAAVNTLNTARSNVGASLSRLEFAQNTVGVQIENTEAAKSTLMDVDVAEEFTKFSSKQVLIQAGVSILAQANQQPQALLRILQ